MVCVVCVVCVCGGCVGIMYGMWWVCRFFGTFVSLMSFKYKEVFEAAAEVVGLVLAYLENHQHVRGRGTLSQETSKSSNSSLSLSPSLSTTWTT